MAGWSHRYTRINGLDVHYVEQGEGPLVVERFRPNVLLTGIGSAFGGSGFGLATARGFAGAFGVAVAALGAAGALLTRTLRTRSAI